MLSQTLDVFKTFNKDDEFIGKSSACHLNNTKLNLLINGYIREDLMSIPTEIIKIIYIFYDNTKPFNVYLEYGDAFKLFDKDGDGIISIQEIHQIFHNFGFKQYSILHIKNMVKTILLNDNDDDDCLIEMDDFIHFFRDKRIQSKYSNELLTFNQQLRNAFAIIDVDGGGEIDAEEIATFMRASGEDITKADIEWLIAENNVWIDSNLDFDDFKKMMKLGPIVT